MHVSKLALLRYFVRTRKGMYVYQNNNDVNLWLHNDSINIYQTYLRDNKNNIYVRSAIRKR